MNAEIGGKLIAPFVNQSWPTNATKIYEILKLALNRAWQEGKWLGMTAEYFCKIHIDKCGTPYILAPQTHPILLAYNQNGKPGTIRDPYFSFHKNGNGSVKDSGGCKWNKDVHDIGYIPTLIHNSLDWSKGVTIGVRALGFASDGEKVYIDGDQLDGNRAYTYQKKDYGNPCGCSYRNQEQEIESIRGISIPVRSNEFTYIDNVKFNSVKSIAKSHTKTPVEIIGIDHYGNGYLLARMEPNQKFSRYRKYIVPKGCNSSCIHGLFKIGQQEDITTPNDPLLISNEEALISFSLGVYQLYHKQDQNLGASYILNGISILEKEKREEESPSEFPIQVDGMLTSDMPCIFNFAS